MGIQYRRFLVWFTMGLPLVMVYNNCQKFSSHSVESFVDESSNFSTQTKFQCEQPDKRAVQRSSSRRLTRNELDLTILSLFGQEIHQQVLNSINLYPQDSINESITEFSPKIANSHINALESLAFAIPEALFSSRSIAGTHLPSCLFSNQSGLNINLSNEDCNRSFVKSLGARIFRRPLTDLEVQPYINTLSSTDSSFSNNQQKIKTVVSALMLSPHFSHILIHLDQQGMIGRLPVDSYTLASRISYAAAGTMPDGDLFTAAQNGDLADLSNREKHARRLLDSRAGRRHVREIFSKYLRLDSASTPSETYADFVGIKTQNLLPELKREALDFVEHIIFEEQGNFQSLLLSQKSFPPSKNAAKVFGLTEASLGPKDAKVTTQGRAGLFMRPVLMVAPEPRTSPIHRGYLFSKQALCLVIPPPSAELLAIGEQLEQEIDPLQVSASEEAEHVTSPITCQGCHTYINPPGHAFERLGAFGDIREEEAIFNGNRQFVRNLPLQSFAEFSLDGEKYVVDSAQQMMKLVANSAGGQGCFSQQMFRYTRFIADTKEDACHLAEVETSIRQKLPLFDVLIKNAASEDFLWQR